MIDLETKTKYKIKFSSEFKNAYKKIKKQKNIDKLKYVIKKLADKETLEPKYCDHALYNDKRFKDCRDCHIEPDWILIYKYLDDELILLLVNTGNHNNLL